MAFAMICQCINGGAQPTEVEGMRGGTFVTVAGHVLGFWGCGGFLFGWVCFGVFGVGGLWGLGGGGFGGGVFFAHGERSLL